MRILNKRQLREKTSLAIQTITRLEKVGKFPRRVKLPPCYTRVGWFEHEVDAWIEARMRERDSR